MKDDLRLTVDALHQNCDPQQFDFETTASLTDLRQIIGQPRAVEAVRFGIGMGQKGYNIFALGLEGTGKQALLRQFFAQAAAQEPVPTDWCYVYNFDQPYKPNALRLPPGQAVEFRHDMERFIEELSTTLPTAFESEEYQTRRQEVEEELREKQEQGMADLQRRAQAKGFTLLRTPAGLAFAPIRNGEVIAPQELQALPEEERQRLETEVVELQEDLQRLLRQLPALQRRLYEQMQTLNREIAGVAVEGLINELRTKYQDDPEVPDYLDALRRDIIENVRNFLGSEGGPQAGPTGGEDESDGGSPPQALSLRRYRVNVLIDHSETTGAPVIYEDNPSFPNLLGRAEHITHLGTLITDFNLLKPGALHQANGGYLILDVRKVLLQPNAWEGLKRALQSGQLRIETPAQAYGLITTTSLEPEPIPLDVKVALVGDPQLYYLLAANDPDFPELFKVVADFAESMDRTPESQKLYAQLIAGLIRQDDLRPFDRNAVAGVIDHSARLAGDAQKLTIQVQPVADLLRESDYWAGQAGRQTVTAVDVQKAINAATYRVDRAREQSQEMILHNTVLIDTGGVKVGQVNGLSVLQLGSFAFGRPSRITARVQLGSGEVIDIEREVELGGPLHSKGVLILSAFLGARYGQDKPLSLAASLVFEQSYGGVDGDSASSAELYALLSAIGEVPINQSLAVTGSVNQLGQVQAIGGVNEKIEGFFDICQARGLTGEQGVLIPAANVRHLMLRPDVIEAASADQFHIYAVETIDQGIELLTGMAAGTPDEEGNYPEDSVNGRVNRRLQEFAEAKSRFDSSTETADKEASA